MRAILLPALLALGACAAAEGPAEQRGFFGGLGAAVSGADERRAQTIEAQATAEQNRALAARADALAAERRRTQSAADLQAANRRLAALDRDIARLRGELETLRARRGPEGAAEGARLGQELDALDRARQAPTAPRDAAALDASRARIEDALRRYGAS